MLLSSLLSCAACVVCEWVRLTHTMLLWLLLLGIVSVFFFIFFFRFTSFCQWQICHCVTFIQLFQFLFTLTLPSELILFSVYLRFFLLVFGDSRAFLQWWCSFLLNTTSSLRVRKFNKISHLEMKDWFSRMRNV